MSAEDACANVRVYDIWVSEKNNLEKSNVENNLFRFRSLPAGLSG